MRKVLSVGSTHIYHMRNRAKVMYLIAIQPKPREIDEILEGSYVMYLIVVQIKPCEFDEVLEGSYVMGLIVT